MESIIPYDVFILSICESTYGEITGYPILPFDSPCICFQIFAFLLTACLFECEPNAERVKVVLLWYHERSTYHPTSNYHQRCVC